MLMKFQKTLMAECKDIDKRHQNAPTMSVSLIVTPQDYSLKIGLCHLCTLGALTSCKKLEKTNRQSLKYICRRT